MQARPSVWESISHFALRTAGLGLAPVLVCKKKKKKRRSLHSARTPRSQEGRLLLHCKQRQPGGARQGVSARRARASQRASGHRSERRDQVSVKSQLSGGKTPSQRRRGAQRC